MFQFNHFDQLPFEIAKIFVSASMWHNVGPNVHLLLLSGLKLN